MARGRMLNRKISLNAKVAELGDRIGAGGVLAYTWAIAHLDRDGRISGDVRRFRAQVCPMADYIENNDIMRMIDECNVLGLVELYETDDGLVVQFPKFAENQSGFRYDREQKTALDIPDGCEKVSGDVRIYSGLDPELLRSRSATSRRKGKERKGKEVKEKEIKVSQSELKTQTQNAPSVLAVFDHWRSYHPRACPKPNRKQRDWTLIAARMREGYSVDDLRRAIDGIHVDPWADRANHLALKYVVKDSDSVDKFREFADKHETGTLQRHANPGGVIDTTARVIARMKEREARNAIENTTEPDRSIDGKNQGLLLAPDTE